jgi:hypothetical protein
MGRDRDDEEVGWAKLLKIHTTVCIMPASPYHNHAVIFD